LIKDNHIAAAGSITAAVASCRERAPHGAKIECEVASPAQVDEALAAGAEVILLDNFTPAQVRDAAVRIGRRAVIEVSGGITLDTLRAYAEAGGQVFSIGALTHGARSADLSLEIEA
jgi:nicotinate-nucleotide pyrophosphorylase (carboxylating)